MTDLVDLVNTLIGILSDVVSIASCQVLGVVDLKKKKGFHVSLFPRVRNGMDDSVCMPERGNLQLHQCWRQLPIQLSLQSFQLRVPWGSCCVPAQHRLCNPVSQSFSQTHATPIELIFETPSWQLGYLRFTSFLALWGSPPALYR